MSKFITNFNYFDRDLTVLYAATGGVFIDSFASVTGPPVGIASARISLEFLITTGIVKKLIKTTRNKKKKCNMIVMLGRSKLNSIENKISKALINIKLFMNTLGQLLMIKKTIVNLKKVLEL